MIVNCVVSLSIALQQLGIFLDSSRIQEHAWRLLERFTLLFLQRLEDQPGSGVAKSPQVIGDLIFLDVLINAWGPAVQDVEGHLREKISRLLSEVGLWILLVGTIVDKMIAASYRV
jgi:hypothetical protein